MRQQDPEHLLACLVADVPPAELLAAPSPIRHSGAFQLCEHRTRNAGHCVRGLRPTVDQGPNSFLVRLRAIRHLESLRVSQFGHPINHPWTAVDSVSLLRRWCATSRIIYLSTHVFRESDWASTASSNKNGLD